MTGKWKKMTDNDMMDEGNDIYSRKSKYQSQKSAKDDFSPPRRRRHDSSSEDEQKPRKRRHDTSSDESPARNKKRNDSSSGDNQGHKRTNSDSDASPPRRKHLSNRQSDSDFSPPRNNRNDKSTNLPEDSDNSPARSRQQNNRSDSDNSPPRSRNKMKQSDSDNSPPRSKNDTNLAKKTLDGKKAGLQNAGSLKSEMDKIRREEKQRLSALSSEVSGKGAQTMVRGRLKEKQAEEERRKAETEIPDAVKEKYSRWSKG